MDADSREKYYSLHELPKDVSVASSVLELDRTHLDTKLREILGEQLTDLLVAPEGDKLKYGAQVSVEDDTSWVYIEETWNQNGYEVYRTATTGMRENDTYLGLNIRTPQVVAGNLDNHVSLEVNIDAEGNITNIRGTGIQSVNFNKDNIPYVKSLIGMKGLEDFKREADARFQKERILTFVWDIDFKDNRPISSTARTTNLIHAGNGYKMQKLEFEDGALAYGEALTNIPLFTRIDTAPIKQ